MAGGRPRTTIDDLPSSWRSDVLAIAAVKVWHRKLKDIGATDFELLMCAICNYGKREYFAFSNFLRKQDRLGINAARKKARNAKEKEKRDSDPSYRLMTTVRARMAGAMNCSRLGRRLGRLPYTAGELKSHLESMFLPGMSWQNYGVKGWHIDHVRPCASFDLSEQDQFDECWSLANLQPLWASDNLRKGSKYG